MSPTEVHPLRSMNRPSQNAAAATAATRGQMLVLYALVGEELEQVEDGKGKQPDTNWNAFALPPPSDRDGVVRLQHLRRAFPLGGNFHFAFRCNSGAFLDLTDPRAAIPYWDGKIVARITPLEEAPVEEYIARREPEPAEEESGHVEEQMHHDHDYVEFESTYESQDEEPPEPMRTRVESRPERRKQQQQQHEWESYQQGQAQNAGNMRRTDDRYTEDGGGGAGGRPSEWAEAGKDAQAFLRKQTEQAYDFAKKISIEDAKKGASETAKKAKKWGGSLLSSISASISNAASTVKNETLQVGDLTVNVVRPLGEGAYAQVLLVRSAATNETFALKRVICQSQEVENDVKTELQVLQAVKSLNIMPLVTFAEARLQNLEFYFLFPYFERGSLWDAIEAANNSSSPLWPFTQHAALHLFHGICSGVLALHRAGFCHRDLKPHNVLLSSSSKGEDFLAYIPVLCDFGSCTPLSVEIRTRKNSMDVQDEANRKSSAPYRAPELFEPNLDTSIDGQSDVWSLGCMLYAMAFGISPFEHPREGFMKLACMNGRVSFPPEQGGRIRNRGTAFTPEFCDFIRDMLHTNPEERPSVLDAIEFAEELLQDEVRR